jgi:hypothetical protein
MEKRLLVPWESIWLGEISTYDDKGSEIPFLGMKIATGPLGDLIFHLAFLPILPEYENRVRKTFTEFVEAVIAMQESKNA